MKKIIILLTIGIIQLGFSQSKKEIEVGDFSKLSVYDKIEVTLVSSDNNKVEITGNDIDNVSVVNKNGSLKIKMNLVNSFQGDNVKATLYYKKLDQITAESGSSIKGSDRIKAVSLDVNAKNGSTINLIVDSERLNVKAGSGSIAQISGKASVQDVLSNSGAKVQNKDLLSNQTDVTVNAGGQAEVNAAELVNAKTRAGGEIIIYGSPKKINEKSIAGGIIKQANK